MFTLKSKISSFAATFASRILPAVVGILAGAAVLSAQTQITGNSLLIQLKNGDEQVFMLASEPVITFNGGDCMIKSIDFSATYAMGDINLARFVYTDPASVNEIETALVVDLSNPERVVIHGMTARGEVRLFDLSGVELRRCSADDCGEASLDLSGLPAAVYIVNTKETTFKLYRK